MYFCLMMIDTHTHLYVSEFDADRTDVIKRAMDVGVNQFVLPAIDSETTDVMHALKRDYPENIHLMMGLHPTHVGENLKEELEHVEKQLATNSYVAVGEIGMDLYWDKTYQKEQQDAFAKQIIWALAYDLPIVIHCREAYDEIFEVLEGAQDDGLRGIFHCFTGDLKQARRAIDLNMLLGIGGVVTFKSSGLAHTVASIPIEHIVLETDAPYLAPTPFRGKRNESSYIIYVAEKLALIHNISLAQVSKLTTENATNLFRL